MRAKLLICFAVFNSSYQLIITNNDQATETTLFVNFLKENLQKSNSKQLHLIHDHLSRIAATNIIRMMNDNLATYVVWNCNREKVLIENALIIAVVNSQRNNYHADCFKYLTVYDAKMILLDTSELTIDSFANILRYLNYNDHIYGVYRSGDTLVALQYDRHLKKARAINLDARNRLIADDRHDVRGETFNVLLMDATELIIGDERLKFEDDLLETAIASLNGTVRYASGIDFRFLTRWHLNRYDVFAIITRRDLPILTDQFRQTYPYEMTYLALIVPKSKPQTLEDNLMAIHEPGVWLFFALYDKMYGAIWTIVRLLTKQSCKTYYCFSSNVLFGDAFYGRLEKTAFESLLLLSQMWFTFFAMSTFQVQIITSMTSVKFTHQVQSLNELCDTADDIELSIDEENARTVRDIYSSSCEKLPSIIRPVRAKEPSIFVNELFLNVRRENATGYILDETHARLIATSRFNRDQGLPLYFVTSDRLLPQFKSYHIRKSSCYYEAINKRIISLYESGFLIYRSEQIRHKYRLKGLLYPDDYVDSRELTKANVSKMMRYFFILYVIAIAHLILELIFKRLELWLASKNINLYFWTTLINNFED